MIVFLVLVFAFRFTGGIFDTYFVYIFPVLSLVALVLAWWYRHEPRPKIITTQDIAAWAQHRGFQFSVPATDNEDIQRMLEAAQHKTYFGFRDVFLQRRDRLRGYWCATGTVGARRIHVFATNSGWCVDIVTKPIPVFVRVMHRFFDAKDTMDTESGSFEERYDLNTPRAGRVLQLLDPVMIELIDKSDIAGLEFGDRSVALYRTLLNDPHEFDAMIDSGIGIAEQAERNFPTGQ